MKAGAFTPATPEPAETAPEPEPEPRSMKAGAFTPATQARDDANFNVDSFAQ